MGKTVLESNNLNNIVFILIFIIILGGTIWYFSDPVCGNGKLEKGETSETCCIDAGCINEMNCNNNSCIEPICKDFQYLSNHSCINYSIMSNSDCNDNEFFLNYSCIELNCSDLQYSSEHICKNVSCYNDEICDDNNESTLDFCSNPKKPEAKCINEFIPECKRDMDCDDDEYCENFRCKIYVKTELISFDDYLYNSFSVADKNMPEKKYNLEVLKRYNESLLKIDEKANDFLDENYIIGSHDDYLFSSFFVFYTAPICNKEYIIQRKKLSIDFFDKDNKKIKEEVSYLVDVWDLNDEKKSFLALENIRHFKLGYEYKKSYKEDIEIGCGIIKGKLNNFFWPFSKRFFIYQKYIDSPGIFYDVNYTKSINYSVIGEFSKNGSFFEKIDHLNLYKEG